MKAICSVLLLMFFIAVDAQAATCRAGEAAVRGSQTGYEEDKTAANETSEKELSFSDVLERLARLLRAAHSYSVPQITMRTERCMADYAQWLRSQVSARDVADTAERAAAPRITAA